MNMDWKLVSAFATGAVLASGIVYFFVKPDPVVRQDVPRQVVAPPARRVTPPSRVPQIAAVPPIPAIEKPAPVARVHLPIREKPSPMPPPVRRPKQEPVIARNLPPPSPAPALVESAPTAVSPTLSPAPAVRPPAENVPVQNVSLPPPPVEARVPPTVTMAAGTVVPVRIGETLSSARNQVGESFLATLTQPLVLSGWVIAERGARVEGRIVDATQGGRLRAVPHLEISIIRVTLSDGQNIRIRTEPYGRDGSSTAGIFGNLVGHKPAEIPVETRLTFHVLDSLTITERVN